MNAWDGKLLSHCGVCGKPIRVEFRFLAEHLNNGSEPICADCANLREQVRESIRKQKESL